jgi:hypothetical protein
VSIDRNKAKEVLHNVVGASMTVAQSATQAAQDFVAEKSPQIRQQSRNAKMIGQFVVRMGASKAGELVGKARQSAPKAEQQTEAARVDVAAPQQSESTPVEDPIPNYSVLSAPQIIELLPTLDVSEVEAIKEFELVNRNRRSVLAAVEAYLQP